METTETHTGAGWQSQDAQRRALESFIDTAAGVLHARNAVTQHTFDMHEMEFKVLTEKRRVAVRELVICRQEWELFWLQCAHTQCPRPQAATAPGDGGENSESLSLLAKDLDEHMSRMSVLDQQMTDTGAELARARETKERLAAELAVARERVDQLDASCTARMRLLQEQRQRWLEEHQGCTSRVSGELLPESIVLEIFRCLPLKDLVLSAAPVCTTWRRVACDNSIWRDANLPKLDHTGEWDPTAIAILKEAPTWGVLPFEFSDAVPDPVYQLLQEREYIPSLDVKLVGDVPGDLLVLILGKHSHQFKRLTFTVSRLYRSGVDSRIFELISTMVNLKVLHLLRALPFFNSVNTDFSNLRLEELSCTKFNFPNEGLAMSLVCASQTSLKSVTFDNSVESSVIQCLGLCPNLEVVNVPLTKGIAALSTCYNIQDLGIYDYIHYSDSPNARQAAYGEAAALLASSPLRDRIENVGFWHQTHASLLAAIQFNLPALKTLTIQALHWDLPHSNSLLLDMVRNSPLLVSLDVSPVALEDLEELLEHDDAVPNLQTLYLREADFLHQYPKNMVQYRIRIHRQNVEIEWV